MNDDAHGPERPPATLPATLRLRTQRHFKRVYQRGRRASGAWMTVVAHFDRTTPDTRGLAAPRLGLSVSKDHGGAVRRNKLKRLLREAFRLERHQLPPVDLVLIPKQRADQFPLAELRHELVALLRRLQQTPQQQRRHHPRGDHSRSNDPRSNHPRSNHPRSNDRRQEPRRDAP